MIRSRCVLTLSLVLTLTPALACKAADEPAYTRAEDVIYGRKPGVALTMDVFTPKEGANGLGVIWVVSGGWFSSHEAVNPAIFAPLLKRGYTVFAVVHGSQPKYTIPEIMSDMNRATRYIRYHAKDYKIAPERLGISGGSAGGHLSLMQGLAGDEGNKTAKDPVDQTSSRIGAVACFFPPTDFLNYGEEGNNAIGRGILAPYRAAMDFHEFNKDTHAFERITGEDRIAELGRSISPITFASSDDPPTLIIHGDADKLVPIQQAEILVAKLKDAGVPAKLVVKTGAGHGWANLPKDVETLADWFDEHLKNNHKK